MLDLPATINHVRSYIRRVLTTALTKSDRILSITIPLNGPNLRSLPKTEGDWFFWSHPDDSKAILGMGRAIHFTTSGPERFRLLNKKIQHLCDNWEWVDPEDTGSEPLSYLCFAFNPADRMTGPWSGLPNSTLYVPELTIQQQGDNCTATFSVDLSKNIKTETIHQRWTRLIALFIDSINQEYAPPGCKTTLMRLSTSASQSQWC